MTNQLFYRNPVSGLVEFKDLDFKPGRYQSYIQTDEGLALKEFATDATLALLRISDPVLTNLAQGFTNAELIGDKLFTSVKVAKESGRFPAFGEEAFVIVGNLKRAVGGTVAKMNVQEGYVTLTLDEYALGFGIDNRERNEFAGGPEMLLNGRTNTVVNTVMLYREYLQAVAATTTTNYASGHYISGAGKAWGGAGTGDPVADMDDLQELVLKKTGRKGNVAFFSHGAWLLFKNNSAVLARIKYGGTPITPSQMSVQAAAQLLEVEEVVVGNAIYGYGSPGRGKVKGTALTKAFVWDSVQSNNAGVLIRGKGTGIEPAFGYTWEKLNSPIIESWYNNATKSQMYDYEHFFNPAITLNTAGAMYYSLA